MGDDGTTNPEDAARDDFQKPPENLYEILFTKLNQEGDGIWGRFNILVAINFALFAGFGYVCLRTDRPKAWYVIGWAICVVGVLFSGDNVTSL